MYRFLTLTKAMFLIHIRDKSLLFWNFAFPVFLMVINGAAFGGDGLAEFMSWLMPGVLAANLLAFGLISSSSVMTELRAKGVLRRLQASPISSGLLLGAYAIANVAMALATAIVVVLVGVAVYGVKLDILHVALALPMIVIGVVASIAIGQVVSGVAPRAGAAVAIGQVLYFGQMFITDLFMPLKYMPDWAQQVGPWLPGYAMAHLVRPALIDGILGEGWALNLALLAAYTAAGMLLASRLFKWEARPA